MASERTISEQAFEDFCRDHQIPVTRVDLGESPEGVQEPDYEIELRGERIIVEVKQLDPNPDETRMLSVLESGGIGEGSGEIGARVRKKIKEANSQIRSRSDRKIPALLVIYDSNPIPGHTSPYQIRAAMYGFETYRLNVPSDRSQPIRVVDKTFGPKRSFTKDHNTSISALVVLGPFETKPRVYHNSFARNPIPPEVFAELPVSQYVLEVKRSGQFQEWTDVTIGK